MLSTGMTSVRSGSYIPRKAYGRFEFIVCDWSLTKSAPSENVVSHKFVMSDASVWVLRIFPGGSSTRQAGFVSVHMALIELGNNPESVKATFKISVLDRKEKRQGNETDVDRIYSLKSPSAMDFSLTSDSQSSWTIDNFMLLQDLESKYLDNDAVLFALDIEVLGKPEGLNTAMPAYLGPNGTLSDDLGALLNDQDEAAFGDITIVSGEKKFRCHRSVLAARSDFFKKKFHGGAFNTKLLFNGGHYLIEDMKPLVFEEMIKFMYTDICRYLSKIRKNYTYMIMHI